MTTDKGRGAGAASAQGVVDPPFEIDRPAEQTLPLVFDSPHSGRLYPGAFLARSRLDALAIRRSEDSFVDELFAGVVAAGAPLLKANFPRAFVDVNREPYELDPSMFSDALPAHANTRSLRATGGLGTIARIVGDGSEIYREKLSFTEAEQRIRTLYRPYHAALSGLIAETKRRFGQSILVDCHSMPSLSGQGDEDVSQARPDVVLGDRFGASCGLAIVTTAERFLRERGYRVARNNPYAGGYITEHYGRPARGTHALQIELNRALYMDEWRLERHQGFARVAADMKLLAGLLGDVQTPSLAAE